MEEKAKDFDGVERLTEDHYVHMLTNLIFGNATLLQSHSKKRENLCGIY